MSWDILPGIIILTGTWMRRIDSHAVILHPIKTGDKWQVAGDRNEDGRQQEHSTSNFERRTSNIQCNCRQDAGATGGRRDARG